MADLNGGVIGVSNAVQDISQSEVISTFNSSGTLTTEQHTTQLQYLIIAGGGGGGGSNGGANHVGVKGSDSSIAGTPITTVT